MFQLQVDDPKIAEKHGVEKFPTLVYFNSEIPSVYSEADLSDGEEVMEWLVRLVEGADIEAVTGDMLDKMITKSMFVFTFSAYKHFANKITNYAVELLP